MRCPSCGEDLRRALSNDAARCPGCGQVYEVCDGVLEPLEDYDLAGEGHNVRYGGVKVEMGRHGVFVDTDAAQRKILFRIRHWIESKILGCILTIVFFIIFIAVLAGVGWYVYTQHQAVKGSKQPGATGASKAGTEPERLRWTGSTTLRCSSGYKRVQGVTATLAKGAAVDIGGSCHLLLVDVHLKAPVGIKAAGSAKLEMRGGSVTGSKHAVSALGSARVTLKGTKVKGKVRRLGRAKVVGP